MLLTEIQCIYVGLLTVAFVDFETNGTTETSTVKLLEETLYAEAEIPRRVPR